MEPFEYAVASGFDAFEWFPDRTDDGKGWDEQDIDHDSRRYIRSTALRSDIVLSAHIPWRLDLTNPAHFARATEVVVFAKEIGAVLLTVHFEDTQDILVYKDALSALLNEHLEPYMKLAFENTPKTSPERLNDLFVLLKDQCQRTSRIGMCLDLGHANLNWSTRNDYLGFIDALDPALPIIHIHLHENYGDTDSHLPLFTGPSVRDKSGIQGFVDRMKHRHFSGAIILEQWPQPPSLLNHARELLKEAFGEHGAMGRT